MSNNTQKAKDVVQDLKNTVKDTAHDVKNRVKDAAHDVKNDVKDAAHDVKNDAKDASKSAAHDLTAQGNHQEIAGLPAKSNAGRQAAKRCSAASCNEC